MTSIAGVGYFALRRRGRWDELEGVGAHVRIGELGFDFRHMAVHTLVAGAAGGVLRMSFDRGGVRAVGGTGAVAL